MQKKMKNTKVKQKQQQQQQQQQKDIKKGTDQGETEIEWFYYKIITLLFAVLLNDFW